VGCWPSCPRCQILAFQTETWLRPSPGSQRPNGQHLAFRDLVLKQSSTVANYFATVYGKKDCHMDLLGLFISYGESTKQKRK